MSELTPTLTTFFLFLSVMAAFLFSGMEAGMLALNPLKLHRSARIGNKSAQTLLRYLENPEMFLWVNLIGGTAANFFSVYILMVTFYRYPKPYFLLIILVCLVALYFVGDLIPKTIFRKKPQLFCSLGLPVFRVAYVLLYPLVKCLILAASFLFWKRRNMSYGGQILSNRAELRRLMRNSDPDITQEERFMIEHVMDFFDMTLKEMYIPMPKVKGVPTHYTLAQAIQTSRETGFTRLPVYQVYVGGEHRTVGILSMKTIIYQEDVDDVKRVTDFINPPLFFHPDFHLHEALSKMQKSGQRMAIIMDNEGKELGIVTLQDILGAIFGKLNL